MSSSPNAAGTATPWLITGQSHRSYEGPEIGTADKTVCVILCATDKPSPQELADAETIVRAVNCHDPLVAALERLSAAVARGAADCQPELQQAQQALQLVRHVKLTASDDATPPSGDLF